MAYQSRYMREKYGESDNSFKEYVSRVQQAIDKGPRGAAQRAPKKKKANANILNRAVWTATSEHGARRLERFWRE